MPLTVRHRLLRLELWKPLVSEEGFRCIPLGGYLPDWAVHLALEDSDNFRHKERRKNNFLWVREDSPTLADMTAELTADRARFGVSSDSTLDLTTLILARGASNETYGSSRFDALDEAVLHKMVECQIDWSRSTSPDSERWKEWGGTFEEEDHYIDMLGLFLYCTCEDMKRWREQPTELGFSMPSIANLISALSSGQLMTLFGQED